MCHVGVKVQVLGVNFLIRGRNTSFWMSRLEDAASIQSLLIKAGLVGSKLALSHGDEDELAKQVAAELGLEPEAWVREYIHNLVAAAVAADQLEERLTRESSKVGVQRVEEAVLAKEKEKKSKVLEEIERGAQIPRPRAGKLTKPWQPVVSTLEPEQDRDRVILAVLWEELKIFRAPILEQIGESLSPERAKEALVGKYRPTTVKRYLTYWQGFRKWCWIMTGRTVPTSGVQLVDYLYAREEEGVGPSIPIAVSQAVHWFEKVAGIHDAERMSDAPLVRMAVEELTTRLESKAPPVRRAPRMLVAFLPALEALVMNEKERSWVRAGAWIKLVKVWASLRFDDFANVKAGLIRFYDGSLSGILRKTKTTGAGKRVRELPIHVSEEAYIVEKEWLGRGLQLLGDLGPKDRELLVGSGMTTGKMMGSKLMTYVEAVAISAEVFAAMRHPNGSFLVPDSWERFWTEHSERATLASDLAALGVVKSERDLLGRWSPEGSDQYVRSYNAVITRLQRVFAAAVRRGDAYKRLDEGAVLEDLKIWLVEKWRMDKEGAIRAVDNWKNKVKVGPMDGADSEELGAATEVASSSEDTPLDTPPPTITDEGMLNRVKMRKIEGERTASFLVVFNRINRGKLHRLGQQGCWMARCREFNNAELYEELPAPEMYSSRCKLCWPEKGQPDQESSSDSEEELAISGKVREIVRDVGETESPPV